MPRHLLTGSERLPMAGAYAIGRADPAERLEATVLVRRRATEKLRERVAKLEARDRVAMLAPGAKAASGDRTAYLSRAEFAAAHGADPADIAAVTKFAHANGLAVVQADNARRTVVLSGTVTQFNAAFDVDLQHFEYDGGSYRGRTGAIQVPADLHGVVEAVLGLDNRPAARPHFRGAPSNGNVHWHIEPPTSFTPPTMAQIYDFPVGNGKGECIAIIELGGGYRLADLKSYFAGLNIPTPKVTAISVDHGKNHPTGDPNGPDGEVMLDIEVAGAVATGAHLAVYFAPNTDAGFLDAITTAAHDQVNKPSVISISWGGAEASWTDQAMTAFDSAFQAAAALGITVLVAAGDGGSSDGVNDGQNHVDFPASSPYATACGGTRVQASGTALNQESVWNDGAQGGATGGGLSTFFPLPAWQDGLQYTTSKGAIGPLASRGVPDVAGDADPESGYAVRVDGHNTVIGGTSAVAPLWAGLIALINARNGTPAGYINPILYKNQNAFNDVKIGNNGNYAAVAGWDACTGLGSPIGDRLAAVL